MMAQLVNTSSRALGMLVSIVMWWFPTHRAFPSNWLAVGILFLALIPVALFYGWLTESQFKHGVGQLLFPVPKPVVIGIGTLLAFFAFVTFD
jgi:hypothetical protein